MRWLIGYACLGFGALHGQTDGAAGAWRAVEELDWLRGTAEFRERSAAAGEEDWETEYGLAVSLLNTPPKTPGRVAEAEARLERVAAAADPVLQTRARYFLGRCAELHRAKVDLAVARQRYAEAIRYAPAGDLFGELAEVRLVELNLFWGADVGSELREGEEAVARLRQPIARRSLLVMLAYAQLFTGGDRGAALRYLREADEIDRGLGTQRQYSYALEPPLIVLGAEAGEWDLVRRMAKRFAERYPQDQRVRHLQQLAAGEVAP